MIYYALGFLLCGLILRAVILKIAKNAGHNLAIKFAKIGDMKGLTYDDIKNKAGEANFVNPNQDGFVAVWAKRGYYIEINFDKDKNFISISKELLST